MRSSHDSKASQQSNANMFAMSISHSTIGDNLAFSGSKSLLPSTLASGESLESTVSDLELGGSVHFALFFLFTNLDFFFVSHFFYYSRSFFLTWPHLLTV
jgi:hypothetical protein